MTITLLYGCGQIETVVADLAKARDFMTEVLGGGEIEQKMAREISALFPPGEYVLEHYDCGGGLFQFNAPSPDARFGDTTPVHRAYLDRLGPCVTNLNYYVDDATHARELLTAMGAPVHIEGPSDLIESLRDYGPENTRPGGHARNFYFLGSRDLIGFDLELMEPNFRRFTRQTAQYPCFVRPRPAVGDGNLQLHGLRLVVPDIEAAYAALVKLFAPASRSRAYAIQGAGAVRSFRIGLGGLELQYAQPVAPGRLADDLERYGPGVLGAEFGARDLEPVLERARAAGAPITWRDGEDACELASRDRVGFTTILRRGSADQTGLSVW